MNFLNPAVLFGLGAIAVPVAIHFINKFQVRDIQWAAMRFLEESLLQVQKRVQLEDLLLLLLRCLLVAALIFAFARPALKSLLRNTSTGTGPLAAVVLLDNSASMGQSDGVQTRFELGKKSVRDWIDGLQSGSTVALYTVSNRVDPLVAKPSSDFAMSRHALDQAQLSDRGTDFLQGIRTAYQVLKNVQSSSAREVHVYTDDQTAAWVHLEEIKKITEENPDIRLRPIIVGKKGEDNLGITALKSEGGVPAVNQPSRFQVTVGNYGSQPVDSVRVTISADGAPPSDETLVGRIEPGATQVASLFARFPNAGYHTVTAAISSDRLAVDNQRTVAVEVASRVGALVLEGDTTLSGMDRDGFFLANALVPLASDRAATFYLKVKVAPLAGFDKTALASNEVVFLSNPGPITPDVAQTFKDYVTNGGNLVIFPGPRTEPDKWKTNTTWWDLLPASIGAVRDATGKSVTWQSSGFQHAITSFWNDKNQGNLGAVRFTKYFPLQLNAPPPAKDPKDAKDAAPKDVSSVIINFDNGEPSVVERSLGKGHVVLFSSTATTQWNNLPLHPAFVPFIQRLLGFLNRQHETRLLLAPGEGFELNVPISLLGNNFSVLRPEKDAEKRTAGKVELAGDRAFIRYTDTEALGAYKVFLGDEATPAAVFSVQLDPAESDLRQMDLKDIESPSVTEKPATGAETQPEYRTVVTREFWIWLIWIAAAFAVVETLLAHRLSQSR